MPTPPEDLPVTLHHEYVSHLHKPPSIEFRCSIYPGIDPTSHFKNKTYAGKIVLITGSSRGIGQEIALFYARSGASLALLARDQSSLDVVKELILKDEEVVKDGSVRVEVFVADVCDVKEVEGAVRGAVGKFGKLDIVVANAGKADLYDRRTSFHSFLHSDSSSLRRQLSRKTIRRNGGRLLKSTSEACTISHSQSILLDLRVRSNVY